MKPQLRKFLLALLLVAVPVCGAIYCAERLGFLQKNTPLLGFLHSNSPMRMTCPYGMAPVAFDAYIRACQRAKVNPNRITQTIGDAPLSVRYHWKDGVVKQNGITYDYSTAVDIHVLGLTPKKIARLQEELLKQGFIGWYRHKGKFKNREHIHAVYAFLPMKRQLRGQVLEYLSERRAAGLPRPKWEKKLRRSRHMSRYF